MKKKVEVAVRMRPLIYEYEDVQAWSVNEQTKKITSLPRGLALRNNSSILNEDPVPNQKRKPSRVELNNVYQFACDYVFPDTANNKNVYQACCSHAISEFIKGHHATIFMYGQTTSGKTYTMLGNNGREGIIAYSLHHIFSRISNKQTPTISYLEIYNQQINDLLNQGSNNLKISEDCVQGLGYWPVTNFEEGLKLLEAGEQQRAYSEKSNHDHSSRSHTIFQIQLNQPNHPRAVLNLVDLSGSERMSDEECSEETAYINKSLFVLSNVIHKLANRRKSTHIPFRDSKLTRLLAPSLTSSRTTVIICTISPAQINFSQTMSTLRFATQSRKIQLRSVDESLNESVETSKKQIDRLMQQNGMLKRNLTVKQNSSKSMRSTSVFLSHKAEQIEQGMPASVGSLKEWRAKVGTLSEEYEKNIEILQRQYLKALVNLASCEFGVQKEEIRAIIGNS